MERYVSLMESKLLFGVYDVVGESMLSQSKFQTVS